MIALTLIMPSTSPEVTLPLLFASKRRWWDLSLLGGMGLGLSIHARLLAEVWLGKTTQVGGFFL
jgi:hypothetical protein